MVHRDAGLIALAIVARLHGKALDPEQVRHELAIEGAAQADDLLRAARRIGFKAVLDTLDLRCMCAPLPCIVELKDGAGFAVLARSEGGRALIHEDGRPQAIALVALQARLSGGALFLATRAPSYRGLVHRVGQFHISEGSVLLESQVQNLVDAMVAFATPQLDAIIAASWQ